MTQIDSIDPRTGLVLGPVAPETTMEQVDELARTAERCAPEWEAFGRAGRAGILRALADGLEARRTDIVAVADRETALGVDRLDGELTRTQYQLRLFAEVLEEGSYVEAVIDHAGDTPMGPRPDLRRMLVPVGPVAVFGASNFPLAFSVPGGDTASALAAGCPVLVKAHSSHAETSRLCHEVMAAAALRAGAPEGLLGVVFGQDAGGALVAHPAIKAVGFTGSLSGGRALMDIIATRPEPIPFFGELSSLNPVVVTADALTARGAEIAEGMVGSYTLGGGQFCTKPGLVFVPATPDGDRLTDEASARVRKVPAAVLLNGRIAGSYHAHSGDLMSHAQVTAVAHGQEATGEGFDATPQLLSLRARDLRDIGIDEVFGPLTVLARYDDEQELFDALSLLPSSLTFTLQAQETDAAFVARLLARMRSRAGRFLMNGWPTGVAVAWAQHHGGPWPATNTAHTSVGSTAIRRFLRPVAYQSMPADLLPTELRDETLSLPRRVDGILALPG